MHNVQIILKKFYYVDDEEEVKGRHSYLVARAILYKR